MDVALEFKHDKHNSHQFLKLQKGHIASTTSGTKESSQKKIIKDKFLSLEGSESWSKQGFEAMGWLSDVAIRERAI